MDPVYMNPVIVINAEKGYVYHIIIILSLIIIYISGNPW